MALPKVFLEVCERKGWRRDGNEATLTLSDGRKQTLLIDPFVFEGEEMARIFTRVGPLADLSEIQLSAVLSLNFNLAFGALASCGDDLAIVDTFLVRQVDHDELAFSMTFLAETADRYERQIYGTDQY